MALKKIFVKDLFGHPANADIQLLCWIKAKRHRGSIVFLDLCDSTGMIQAVAERSIIPETVFRSALYTPAESVIEAKGILTSHPKKPREISLRDIRVINPATKQLSPRPREDIDIFDPRLTNHLLAHRHAYLRNPKLMAILQFRSILMGHIRQWFAENQFLEFHAPILTPVPLYHDDSAMGIDVHDESVFLTQCVGFYLEAAADAFERVYNIGPSFRGEESRSRRHLMEYWHIKAEIAFGDLEDIIRIVEDLLSTVSKKCWNDAEPVLDALGTNMCLDTLRVPYERIMYEEAVDYLQQKGHDFHFGQSLGTEEETILSKLFEGPFWVVGSPRLVEPFPYVVNKDDPRITRVADLIASRGFGEILGTAEKIHDPGILDERMQEKGKLHDPRHEWIRELRQIGCAPHIAFGMGVERLIRWLLDIPHVRDTIPFPRIFRRSIMP